MGQREELVDFGVAKARPIRSYPQMRSSGLRRLLFAIPPALVIMAGTLVGSPGDQASASAAHVHSQPDPASVGAQAPAAAGTFLETFDGLPSSPTPFSNPNGWDIFPSGLDTRQNGTDAQRAHHGPNCGAPGFPYSSTNSHPLQSTQDTVFICNNHLMTATGLIGYGAIYMVPPAMADYSSGTATIRFEMSTLRTGSRDWVYFTLAPFAEHNKVFDDGDSHVPQDSINLRLEGGGNTFTGWQRVGGARTRIDGDSFTQWDNVQAANGVAPDAARRDVFQIDISRTHLRFCIVGNSTGQTYAYKGQNGFCWIDTDLPTPLSTGAWNDQAVFMMTHASYNVEKSCSSEEDEFSIVHNATGDANCPPNTWHWDNVRIAPAVPFSILSPLQRLASFKDPSGTNIVTFSSPAPANAFLSYVAEGDCDQQRFSVNGGATWIAARPQTGESVCARPASGGGEYWTPIPAGTSTVKFTGSATSGRWSAEAIAIWAGGGSLPPVAIQPAPPAPVQPPAPAQPPASPPQPQASASLDFRSAWVDQSAYPSVAPGATAQVTLHFRNTGTQTWQRGVLGRQVNLGVVGDSTEFADLGLAVNWPSANRVATTVEASVAPGQVGTFSFTVRAPVPGTYQIPLRLVADGVSWLDDQGVFVKVVSDLGHHSAWAWQSGAPVLRPGELSDALTFVFRNTGTSTWRRGDVVLGVVGDDVSWGSLGADWPSANRVAIQHEAAVGPGALATFTFTMRAPAEPGAYVLGLRPVVEGVAWLEDDGVYTIITVVP